MHAWFGLARTELWRVLYTKASNKLNEVLCHVQTGILKVQVSKDGIGGNMPLSQKFEVIYKRIVNEGQEVSVVEQDRLQCHLFLFPVAF